MIKYEIDDPEYDTVIESLADIMCGYSCGIAADAIIEYCSRPDISKRQIERIVESLTQWID
jgi:hypothetical protein